VDACAGVSSIALWLWNTQSPIAILFACMLAEASCELGLHCYMYWRSTELQCLDATQAKLQPKQFVEPQFNKQLQTTVPRVSHMFRQNEEIRPISEFLEKPDDPDAYFAPYNVPISTIEKSVFLMDIVLPEETKTRCFTKSYGRFIEGAGSVLQQAPKVCSSHSLVVCLFDG
jgi:hypothetical protein